MRSQDKESAFKFDNKLYHYKRMPFGLSTAMQTFMRLKTQMFQLPFVKIYVDDVPMISKNETDHIEHLKAVFQVVKESGMTLNRKKCKFFKDSIEYHLGLLVYWSS